MVGLGQLRGTGGWFELERVERRADEGVVADESGDVDDALIAEAGVEGGKGIVADAVVGEEFADKADDVGFFVGERREVAAFGDGVDNDLTDAGFASEADVTGPHDGGVEVSSGGEDGSFALGGGQVGAPADIVAEGRAGDGEFGAVEEYAVGAGDGAVAEGGNLIEGVVERFGRVIAVGHVWQSGHWYLGSRRCFGVGASALVVVVGAGWGILGGVHHVRKSMVGRRLYFDVRVAFLGHETGVIQGVQCLCRLTKIRRRIWRR